MDELVQKRTKETQRGSLSDQPKQGTIVRKIPQIAKPVHQVESLQKGSHVMILAQCHGN